MSADTAPRVGRVAAWQRVADRIDQTGDTLSVGEMAERCGYKAGVLRDQMRRDDDPPQGTSRRVLLRPAYDLSGEPRWTKDAPAEFHRLRSSESDAAAQARHDLPSYPRDEAHRRGLASLRRIADVTGVSLTTLSSRLAKRDGFPAPEGVSHHSEGRRPYMLHNYGKVRAHLLELQGQGRRGLKDLDIAGSPTKLPPGGTS